MSLAIVLCVGGLLARCQSSRTRNSSRYSSRTPLLERAAIVDEEQCLGESTVSQDDTNNNSSLYSLYGTFDSFSQTHAAAYNSMTVEPLFTRPASSSIVAKPKELRRWETYTLPSMPNSFAKTYELIKTFPRISMAPVHLVRHRDFGRQMIIKQLQNCVMGDDQPMPEEAYMLTKVLGSHKNIMAIEDIQIAEDGIHVPYANMVMEYANGGDLFTIIDLCIARNEQVPAEFVLHFASSMIDALAFIHDGHVSYNPSTGRPVLVDQPTVLHCDIKPDNIFLNLSQDSEFGMHKILLADFGLAGFEGVQGIRGTRRYFAPELIQADIRASIDEDYRREVRRSSLCSKQSDMYSFAVTLYELIFLQPYQPGDDIRYAFYNSNVVEHIDILFILQSGLSEWAEEREPAAAWHYASFAFKQKLQLWYGSGGRLPPWFPAFQGNAEAAVDLSGTTPLHGEGSGSRLCQFGEDSNGTSADNDEKVGRGREVLP